MQDPLLVKNEFVECLKKGIFFPQHAFFSPKSTPITRKVQGKVHYHYRGGEREEGANCWREKKALQNEKVIFQMHSACWENGEYFPGRGQKHCLLHLQPSLLFTLPISRDHVWSRASVCGLQYLVSVLCYFSAEVTSISHQIQYERGFLIEDNM